MRTDELGNPIGRQHPSHQVTMDVIRISSGPQASPPLGLRTRLAVGLAFAVAGLVLSAGAIVLAVVARHLS
jgi:hypothetical protein